MGQSMGVWSFHDSLGLPPSLQLYVFQEANLTVQEFLYSFISDPHPSKGLEIKLYKISGWGLKIQPCDHLDFLATVAIQRLQ